MPPIPRIIVLVSGAVALGLSIAILVGVPSAEAQQSMLTIGMLFTGIGLLFVGANVVMKSREKTRD